MTARLVMKMKVARVEQDTDQVFLFTLVHPKRAHLPAPTAGAHVDIRLPDGRVRQYSLCGDPGDDRVYRIAVKRENEGRGGSKWIHANLSADDIVHVSAPRNNFPLATHAKRHVFIAGGIGVTPFVAMVCALQAHSDFHLHYCARHRISAPLLSKVQALCGPGRLSTYFPGDDDANRLNLDDVLQGLGSETHVYCCGPQRLTEAVHRLTAHMPAENIHFEVFRPTLDENFKPEPFDITLASSGETLRVPAQKSALEVLRSHGLALPSSCELGVCGACVCGYRDGMVIHRDSVLDVAARQDRMMLCVSRARVGVTLDL